MSIPTLDYCEVLRSSGSSTKTWQVRVDGSIIGHISWFSVWGRYTLQPAAATVWDRNMLSQIIAFCDEQMEIR